MSNLYQKYLGRISTPSLTAGGQSARLRIPSIHMLKKFNLLLEVTTSAALTSVKTENPQTIVKSINFYADGECIKKVRAVDLYYLNTLDRGSAGSRTALTTSTSSGECDLELNFQSLRMTPKDLTDFSAYGCANLDMEIIFGTLDDLGTYTTQTLTACYVDVVGYYEQNVQRITPVSIERYVQVPYTTSGQLSIELSTGRICRLIAIKNETTYGAGAESTNYISNISLSANGKYLFEDVPYAQQKADNKLNYGVESMPTGFVILDFPRQTRDYNQCWDLRLAKDPKLVLTMVYGSGSPIITLHIVELERAGWLIQG